MRIVELDGSGWTTPLDLLSALRAAVGAPGVADIDALSEAMIRGAVALETPCTVRIAGTGHAPSAVKNQIAALTRMIEDARRWRDNHRYGVVSVTLEIAP
jgi:hypothetical protein